MGIHLSDNTGKSIQTIPISVCVGGGEEERQGRELGSWTETQTKLRLGQKLKVMHVTLTF